MRLGIFLKAPLPGRVKTRLCPPLQPLEAADLYACLLHDSLRAAGASQARRLYLFYDGPPPHEYLPPELLDELEGAADPDDPRVREIAQREGGLGERIAGALHDAAREDGVPLLLLGSDNPDLPPTFIDEALAALKDADLVLGPAMDGGAWGIGLRQPNDELLAGIPWSAPDTGSALSARAENLGLRCTTVEKWGDVDGIDDLRSLWGRVENAPDHAPRSARWLANWGGRTRHLEGND